MQRVPTSLAAACGVLGRADFAKRSAYEAGPNTPHAATQSDGLLRVYCQPTAGKCPSQIKIQQTPCSMPEMPHAGINHRHAALVGRINHFLIPDAAARLDDAGGTGVHHHIQPVAKRKERVAGHGRARQA